MLKNLRFICIAALSANLSLVFGLMSRMHTDKWLLLLGVRVLITALLILIAKYAEEAITRKTFKFIFLATTFGGFAAYWDELELYYTAYPEWTVAGLVFACLGILGGTYSYYENKRAKAASKN